MAALKSELFMSLQGTAARLQLDDRTVAKLVAAGRLRGVRVSGGPTSPWLVHRESVEAFAAGRFAEAAAPELAGKAAAN